jgi:hypothetical protein
MSKLSRKVVAVGLTLTTAVWFAGSVIPAFAQTSQATIDALMAQILALQAQLVALQGGSSAPVSTTFTRDLTLGSKGADVTALQQTLVKGGFLSMPAGVAYGYFGSLTKTAVTAWQKSVGVSGTGYFGPKSRVAIGGSVVVTPGGGGVVVSGPSSVALSPLNPATMNVPINSSATAFEVVPVLTVRFTAGPGDVTVTNFNVLRSGLSSDQDLANVYLLDGSKIVTTNIGMNAGTVQFANAAGLFTVKAGTYKDISVAVSISSSASATGHTYQFSVPSAASITTVGAITVGGVFPISGNTMTAASVSNLGGITVTNGSTSNNTSATALSVNAGQAKFNAGQFTLQANNQAVSVQSITLTNTASLAPTELANIALYNGATQIGTAQSIVGNNQVTFDISANPLQLAAGQSVQLFLYADIVGGVNRYFQFSVQHNYDIVAKDMMFNIGFLPAMNTGNFPMSLSYVSVQQGTMTLTRDFASPVNYVLPGGTNQTLAKFKFAAGGEAVKITQLNATITTSTAAAGTLTNVKVIDDQGTQVGTTQTTWAGTIAYTNLNYLIPAGTSRVVSVIADVASTFAGTAVAAVSNIAGQGYTSLATVPTSGFLSSTGNTLSATTNMLTAGLNSTMGTTNVVSGQMNAKIGSFTLTAGSGSGVNVSNFNFTVAAAGYDPAAKYQNLTLKYGTTPIGSVQNVLTNGGSITFSASSPITIAAGGQISLDVYADVKTGVAATSTPGVITLASNGISATAIATNQSITTVAGTPTTGQTVAVVAAGTLTYNAGTMPVAAQVGMGVTGVKLASYQVSGSTNEAITITSVYLTGSSSQAGLFTNFKLMGGAQQYGSALSSGYSAGTYTLSWVGVNIPINQGGSLTLDVIADANTYSALSGVYTASANTSSTAAINQIDYQGNASSQTASASSTASGNQFVLVRNTLSAATASGVSYTTTIGDGAVVGAYTFSAGNAVGTTDPVYLNQLVLNNVFSGATVSSTNNFKLYVLDAGNGNQLIASSTASSTSGSSATFALNMNGAATGGSAGGAGITINKGTSRTLLITADLTGSGANAIAFARTNATVAISFQNKLTNFTWTDGTRAANMISADTAFGYSNVPLVGSANALSL